MTRPDPDVRASVVALAGLGRMPTDARSEAEPDAADRWAAVVRELDQAGDVPWVEVLRRRLANAASGPRRVGAPDGVRP